MVSDSNPDRVTRGLDEAARFVKTYEFELSDDYLSLIDAVEAMPRNQHGANKSGRWLGGRAYAKSPVAKARPAASER